MKDVYKPVYGAVFIGVLTLAALVGAAGVSLAAGPEATVLEEFEPVDMAPARLAPDPVISSPLAQADMVPVRLVPAPMARADRTRLQLAQAKVKVTTKASPEADVNDPLESMNRGIFAFNEFMLKWVLGPISRTYKDIFPDPVRESVGNVLHLVSSPIILGNDLLQGEWKRAWQTTERTAINATVGVAGLIDVADKLGIPKHDEDFGQTLAVWGVGEGFYLVLPFFGPSNPRDAIGKFVDGYFHPLTRWASNTDRDEINYALFSATAVHEYSEVMDELNQIRKTSIDYYAAIRSMFRQRRAAEIRQGREVELPPIPEIGYDLELEDQPAAGAPGPKRPNELSAK